MQLPPRCEVIPLENQQFSFRVDGIEKTRWHGSGTTPRPFFFPMNGPSGQTLTRMGHPGAADHDHHRSVWFAHNKVLGIDFWGDASDARIQQTQWYVMEDGDQSCTLALELAWNDGHEPAPLMTQELIATLSPMNNNEYLLDLQSTFRPTAAELELQQSNFGILAVRVAKSLSGHFGGGTLTGASGEQGEINLFGKSNAWMDYTGPVSVLNVNGERESVIEGITYFDHPVNKYYPAKWHVREDGWMGASACRDAGIIIKRTEPLVLRYLLHAHRNTIQPEVANSISNDWAKRPMRTVVKGKGHQQYLLEPLS